MSKQDTNGTNERSREETNTQRERKKKRSLNYGGNVVREEVKARVHGSNENS